MMFMTKYEKQIKAIICNGSLKEREEIAEVIIQVLREEDKYRLGDKPKIQKLREEEFTAALKLAVQFGYDSHRKGRSESDAWTDYSASVQVCDVPQQPKETPRVSVSDGGNFMIG
jgi:hypothetical protein